MLTDQRFATRVLYTEHIAHVEEGCAPLLDEPYAPLSLPLAPANAPYPAPPAPSRGGLRLAPPSDAQTDAITKIHLDAGGRVRSRERTRPSVKIVMGHGGKLTETSMRW